MLSILFALFRAILDTLKYLGYILDLGWRDQANRSNSAFARSSGRIVTSSEEFSHDFKLGKLSSNSIDLTYIWHTYLKIIRLLNFIANVVTCTVAASWNISYRSQTKTLAAYSKKYLATASIKILSLPHILSKHATRAEKLLHYLPTNLRNGILCYIHSNDGTDTSESDPEAEGSSLKDEAKSKEDSKSRERKVQKDDSVKSTPSFTRTDPVREEPPSSGSVISHIEICQRSREGPARDNSASAQSKHFSEKVSGDKTLGADRSTEKCNKPTDFLSENLVREEPASACSAIIRDSEGERKDSNSVSAPLERTYDPSLHTYKQKDKSDKSDLPEDASSLTSGSKVQYEESQHKRTWQNAYIDFLKEIKQRRDEMSNLMGLVESASVSSEATSDFECEKTDSNTSKSTEGTCDPSLNVATSDFEGEGVDSIIVSAPLKGTCESAKPELPENASEASTGSSAQSAESKLERMWLDSYRDFLKENLGSRADSLDLLVHGDESAPTCSETTRDLEGERTDSNRMSAHLEGTSDTSRNTVSPKDKRDKPNFPEDSSESSSTSNRAQYGESKPELQWLDIYREFVEIYPNRAELRDSSGQGDDSTYSSETTLAFEREKTDSNLIPVPLEETDPSLSSTLKSECVKLDLPKDGPSSPSTSSGAQCAESQRKPNWEDAYCDFLETRPRRTEMLDLLEQADQLASTCSTSARDTEDERPYFIPISDSLERACDPSLNIVNLKEELNNPRLPEDPTGSSSNGDSQCKRNFELAWMDYYRDPVQEPRPDGAELSDLLMQDPESAHSSEAVHDSEREITDPNFIPVPLAEAGSSRNVIKRKDESDKPGFPVDVSRSFTSSSVHHSANQQKCTWEDAYPAFRARLFEDADEIPDLLLQREETVSTCSTVIHDPEIGGADSRNTTPPKRKEAPDESQHDLERAKSASSSEKTKERTDDEMAKASEDKACSEQTRKHASGTHICGPDAEEIYQLERGNKDELPADIKPKDEYKETSLVLKSFGLLPVHRNEIEWIRDLAKKRSKSLRDTLIPVKNRSSAAISELVSDYNERNETEILKEILTMITSSRPTCFVFFPFITIIYDLTEVTRFHLWINLKIFLWAYPSVERLLATSLRDAGIDVSDCAISPLWSEDEREFFVRIYKTLGVIMHLLEDEWSDTADLPDFRKQVADKNLPRPFHKMTVERKGGTYDLDEFELNPISQTDEAAGTSVQRRITELDKTIETSTSELLSSMEFDERSFKSGEISGLTHVHPSKDKRSSLTATSEHTGVKVGEDARFQKELCNVTHESGESSVTTGPEPTASVSPAVCPEKLGDITKMEVETVASDNVPIGALAVLDDNKPRSEELKETSLSTEFMESFLPHGTADLRESQRQSDDTSVKVGRSSDESTTERG